MSKQKCRISKKRSNFSIISNSVSQTLNYNLAALGLYVYLFSLPHDWEFHKSHLRKVCNVGEKKLNNLLKILSDHKLVNVSQIRKENGQFSHFDIDIDDGSAFIHNPQPEGQNCRTAENGGAVKQSYKEDIKAFKKEYKNQERESIVRAKRVPLSDSFVFNEANQKLCMSKNIDSDLVLSKFKANMKASGKKVIDWQAEAELWILRERIANAANPANGKKEVRSNVIEYGPGHPTWEANQEWIRKQGMKHGSDAERNYSGRVNL